MPLMHMRIAADDMFIAEGPCEESTLPVDLLMLRPKLAVRTLQLQHLLLGDGFLEQSLQAGIARRGVHSRAAHRAG